MFLKLKKKYQILCAAGHSSDGYDEYYSTIFVYPFNFYYENIVTSIPNAFLDMLHDSVTFLELNFNCPMLSEIEEVINSHLLSMPITVV